MWTPWHMYSAIWRTCRRHRWGCWQWRKAATCGITTIKPTLYRLLAFSLLLVLLLETCDNLLVHTPFLAGWEITFLCKHSIHAHHYPKHRVDWGLCILITPHTHTHTGHTHTSRQEYSQLDDKFHWIPFILCLPGFFLLQVLFILAHISSGVVRCLKTPLAHGTSDHSSCASP